MIHNEADSHVPNGKLYIKGDKSVVREEHIVLANW